MNLSDLNDAINRFVSGLLGELIPRYFDRAKDFVVSLFWGIVNLVGSVAGFIRGLIR